MSVVFKGSTFRGGRAGKHPLLLDLYTGAAAAYSLRQLTHEYTGPVVQVRRTGDNAEDTFTSDEVSDGTLAAWVTAGGGTEGGFVKTWYDQSGNGNDASQATANNQLQIVQNGAVILENGKPAISSPSGYKTLTRSWGISLSNPQLFYVGKITTTISDYSGHWIDLGNLAGLASHFINRSSDAGSYQDVFNSSRLKYGTFNATLGQRYVECYENVSTITTRYLNGVNRGSNTFSVVTPVNLLIGGSFSIYPANGSIQEVVIYATGNASNRTGIESNIASHYGITLS
jgi:hypothetical protein